MLPVIPPKAPDRSTCFVGGISLQRRVSRVKSSVFANGGDEQKLLFLCLGAGGIASLHEAYGKNQETMVDGHIASHMASLDRPETFEGLASSDLAGWVSSFECGR